MDKRLLAAVNHDPARINFAPNQRVRLMNRYGLRDTAISPAQGSVD
jgi:alkane 1-monooxygenase